MQKNEFFKKKEVVDFGINCVSVGIMGLCGMLYVFLIPILYSVEALGIFDQVYAWYIVLAQLYAFGISNAVVKMIPCIDLEMERWKVLSTACVITMAISVFCNIIFSLVIHVLGSDIELRYRSIIGALLLFPLNKVLLAFMNGLERMRAYACFQCLRYILLVLTILLFYCIGIDGNQLTGIFSIVEIIMLFSMVVYLRIIGIKVEKGNRKYLKELLKFGARIVPTNLVAEATTRVDVMSLGLVLHNDYMIGIYTFAAAFADGFHQIVLVLRKIINPKIARFYYKNELKDKIKEYKKIYYKVIMPVLFVGGVLILLVYRGITCFFMREYVDAWKILAVLLLAIFINSKYIICGNLLSQCGYPEMESFANGMSLIINFAFNIIFILYMESIGAALATALSYIVYSALINWGINKKKILQQ